MTASSLSVAAPVSTMSARAIAFMAGQTSGRCRDFEDIGDWWTRADPKGIFPDHRGADHRGHRRSKSAAPAVITDETTHTKKVIFHPLMMPKIVIADPELTVGMPGFITVGTGLDALAHCLEAWSAPGYHPLADGIAVEGIRLVFENLPKVVANPNDIEARGHMMSAAAMGATAFQKGLGAIHALSHPVGALYDTHHGMTNAVFMPYVLVVNRDAIEARIARLAAYCGLPPSFDAFLHAVTALRTTLNVPLTLRDLKVDTSKRDLIGDMAIVDPTAGGNPIELTKARALEIFDRAIGGGGFNARDRHRFTGRNPSFGLLLPPAGEGVAERRKGAAPTTNLSVRHPRARPGDPAGSSARPHTALGGRIKVRP